MAITFFIGFHFRKQIIASDAWVVLWVEVKRRLTGFRIKRHTPVPWFTVGFSRSVALTFLSGNVYSNRLWWIFYLFRRHQSDQKCCLPSFTKNVVQTHSLEVAVGFSVGFTQKSETFIDTAVIFGDWHIVVIYNDYEVGVEFAAKSRRFESFTAAQSRHRLLQLFSLSPLRGLVPLQDHRQDLPMLSMTYCKVVFAFVRVCVAGNVVIMFG